jgi:CheY-like chemotaxis protein/HPt (histidine-containing phosphotransfer) domain-containing protein
MNAVLGFAGLALRQDLSPKVHNYLQKIHTSGQSLLGIINDILDFSKIEAGRLEMETMPFRLSEVLRNVVDLFAQKASESGLELTVAVGEGVPDDLMGDPLRLSQILINLTGNALKFTPSGHVLIRVELLEQMERQVKLWCFVQDSGIGLSQEQIETLFQAFAQGDASTTRRYGGTGLGLSISRRLVELMGGTITVQSAPGQGSTFAFSAVFTVANTPSEALRPASDILRGLRALVVDDNPVVREVLVEQLWSLGLEAGAVDSGAAALEELQRRSRDLVLMDWRMPGMDGIEAIGRILALPALDPVPKIILLTAFGREEVLRGAQEAGASGFLLKPVTPRLLLEALMEAVGGPSDTIHGLDRELYVAPGTLRGRRVLVVDDNSINLEVALEILKGWGITGTQALSGREAIRILESESFDAVLMDVQMPDMDGYQTTGLIRQMPAHLDLPILAMTANAMERDRLACLEAGMNDFIPKPIEPEHLFAALLQWTPKEPPVPVPPQEPEPPAQPPPPVAVPGAADEGTPKAPLLDLDSALRRLGGNRTLLQELLQSFQRGHAQAATEIRAALDQGNAKQAEHLSHKVRGVAGNLGANRIMDLAGAMEKALRADDLASARNLLEPFSQALDATCDLIADTLPPQ